MTHGSKAAALALLPELTARPVPARRPRHRLLQATLAALATAVMLLTLAVPLALARDTGISEQHETAPVVLDEADLSAYESARLLAAEPGVPAAPVVLSYHDIAPETGDGEYVVTPADFESHLQMLDRAGYESLTLEEFLAYRDGRFTPPARSFLLTFDDGTSGLWRYADPILERYGMNAVSFLITGSVGTRQPYYLTWPEVGAMAESGRWEFGSHTDALHYRTTVDEHGTVGGALTHQVWDDATEDGSTAGPETPEAHARRVADDLDRSIESMTDHGLPAPTAFAYPFSELDNDDQEGAASLIAERFQVAFVNAAAPRPLSLRDIDAPIVERFEVFTGDTDRDVFDGVLAMTSLPVTAQSLPPQDADSSELGDPSHWLTPSRAAAPVRTGGPGLRPAPGTTGFVAAEWAPARTGDWTGYTVTATVSGLSQQGGTVALSARVGSEQPVRVRVSDRQAQVLDHEGRVLSVTDLDPAAQRELRMRVSATSTTVEVDGVVALELPVQPDVTSTGGFALDWGPGSAPDDYALVTALTVAPE